MAKEKLKYITLFLLITLIMITTNQLITEADVKTYNTVVIGDSRIVGLAKHDGVIVNTDEVSSPNTDNTIYYKAKIGIGYNWLRENTSSVKDICNENTTLYIVLGVNDLGNIDNYTSFYNSLQSDLNIKQLIIGEVGRVDEVKEGRYGYAISNTTVEQFNTTLHSNSKNYKVIKFWQGNEENNTVDGIHYTNIEYENTLSLLKANIENEEVKEIETEADVKNTNTLHSNKIRRMFKQTATEVEETQQSLTDDIELNSNIAVGCRSGIMAILTKYIQINLETIG